MSQHLFKATDRKTDPDGLKTLVLFDALPAWLLGCYGGSGETPALDALAAQSEMFDWAFATGDFSEADFDDWTILEAEGVSESLTRPLDDLGWEDLFDQLEEPLVSEVAAACVRVGRERPESWAGSPPHELLDALPSLAEADRCQFELAVLLTRTFQLDCLVEQVVAEVGPCRVAARRGLLPPGLAIADPTHLDTAHQVPLIVPASSPRRRSELVSVSEQLRDEPSASELIFTTPNGASLRDREGLYVRSYDAAGEQTEQFFEKPHDRFNVRDVARERPGVVDDYAARLTRLSTQTPSPG